MSEDSEMDDPTRTANPQLRVWTSECLTQLILNFEGWNSQVRREIPRHIDSTIPSLRTRSLRIDRSSGPRQSSDGSEFGEIPSPEVQTRVERLGDPTSMRPAALWRVTYERQESFLQTCSVVLFQHWR